MTRKLRVCLHSVEDIQTAIEVIPPNGVLLAKVQVDSAEDDAHGNVPVSSQYPRPSDDEGSRLTCGKPTRRAMCAGGSAAGSERSSTISLAEHGAKLVRLRNGSAEMNKRQ